MSTTRVSYVHGPAYVPADEVRQRASEVSSTGGYIPYTSLTVGETALMIERQRWQILADFYQSPELVQGLRMIDAALGGGVSNGVNFVGAVPNELQSLAAFITRASRMTRPTVGTTFGRDLRRGVAIGQPIIPVRDCDQEATIETNEKFGRSWTVTKYRTDDTIGNISPELAFWRNARAKCRTRLDIEKILNDGMEKSGHHTAYGYLPNSNAFPTLAVQKINNQQIAHEELARVGAFPVELVRQWLNVGIMRNNAAVAKIKPLQEIETNAYLTNLPEAGVVEWIQAMQKNRAGAGNTAQLVAILRKYKGTPSVGEPLTATVIAILGAITALTGAVAQFLIALRGKRFDAMAAAKGFGSPSFGPQSGDWDVNANAGSPGGIDTTTLILLGAGAYLLTTEE